MPEQRDLVPVVNLATILVPVAVMTAWVLWPAPPPVDDLPRVELPAGLSIAIGVESGYRVAWVGGDEDTADPDWSVLVDDEGDLLRALRLAKDAHPGVEDVMIVPGSGVTYATVVRTAELARGDGEALFPFAVVSSRGR